MMMFVYVQCQKIFDAIGKAFRTKVQFIYMYIIYVCMEPLYEDAPDMSLIKVPCMVPATQRSVQNYP